MMLHGVFNFISDLTFSSNAENLLVIHTFWDESFRIYIIGSLLISDKNNAKYLRT